MTPLQGRLLNRLYATSWFRRGTTRTVFLVGRYAVKVPITCYGWEMFLRGLLANMQEAKWTRWAKKGMTDPNHRLARVLFALPGGFLNVQERAAIPRNYRRKFTDAVRQDHARLFAGLPWDDNGRNLGFIGRRLVLIDYGT